MSVLLKCNGIWIINGKFGCTWKAEQIKVKVPEKAISGYAFRDDDEDDDMDVVADSNDKVEHELESDSDSDSDSDDEDAEIVEKTVKKRGGVKKE